jgi:hypothetical protein
MSGAKGGGVGIGVGVGENEGEGVSENEGEGVGENEGEGVGENEGERDIEVVTNCEVARLEVTGSDVKEGDNALLGMKIGVDVVA